MKNILLPIAGVALFIIAVGVLTKELQKRGLSPTPIPSATATPGGKQIIIGDTNIFVEIADTDNERKVGLGGRTSLEKAGGMLFVFGKKDVYPSFWMKDMKIAIDIIWINDDKITKIEKNIQPPAPGTKDGELTIYHPDKPIDYVLEVNAGLSDRNNIKVGGLVDLSGI